MLTQKQVKEIKEHLNKAQNPIFYFDNDEDGLCSFIILAKYCEKGKGIPIKSFPQLSLEYFRKVHELQADYIFILDKPLVSPDFIKEAEKYNIPVVWIDHHETQQEIPKHINYYNPLLNKQKTNEPVTALSYQISQKKQDLWLSIIGCVSENFSEPNYKEFKKQYPELTIDSDDPWDIYHSSEIGKASRMLSFGLKDKTSNVVHMLKYLIKSKSPYDILQENKDNKQLHYRFNEIEKKYKKLIQEATEKSKQYKNLLLFEYSGDTAVSSDLSNKMMYLFPKKEIFILRKKGSEIKVSARGPNVKKIYLNIIKNFENAKGGGHDVAIGGQFEESDLEKFKETLIEKVEK
ncbi:MAG: DHHA1 domain-containing protein [Candidatus Pacearchaeota archaeon]|nr:DHHA1 domain-containing protein [Candidatus Pacearchaeota archaeon]